MASNELRDTYKYDFVAPDGTIIHSGITNDPDRREAELRRQYSKLGHLRLVGRRTTRKGAQKWERTKHKALEKRNK